MFSGFWSWFLVFVVVVAIFCADRLPELKQYLQDVSKDGLDAVKKGAKTAQDKIAKVKAEKEKKEAEKNQDNSEE